MRSGRHNRQVTVEYKVVAQDPDYGTEVITWTPLAYTADSPPVAQRFWAEVSDAMPSRAESVKLGLEMARNQTRIRMRWRNDINSSMRITVHGDTDVIYQIVGGPAEIGGRKDMIEMMCERYSS